MGRSRRLDDLRNDAYKRADVEGATDRHPPADVTRYVNQGGAELWDQLLNARARFHRKIPAHTITTTKNTSRYALPEDFYRLLSVRIDGEQGDNLQAFQPEDEPTLRNPSFAGAWPTHYELQPGFIEILPFHDAGLTIVVEYCPVYKDLVADDDRFDGIDGWEEYMVDYAARCMAVKDDQPRVVKMCEDGMARLRERIAQLAPKRDAFRPERIRDVRGERAFGGRRWR